MWEKRVELVGGVSADRGERKGKVNEKWPPAQQQERNNWFCRAQGQNLRTRDTTVIDSKTTASKDRVVVSCVFVRRESQIEKKTLKSHSSFCFDIKTLSYWSSISRQWQCLLEIIRNWVNHRIVVVAMKTKPNKIVSLDWSESEAKWSNDVVMSIFIDFILNVSRRWLLSLLRFDSQDLKERIGSFMTTPRSNLSWAKTLDTTSFALLANGIAYIQL